MEFFKQKVFIETAISLFVIALIGGGIYFLGGLISTYAKDTADTRTKTLERSASLNSMASLKKQYNDVAERDLLIMQTAVPVKDQLINLEKEYKLIAMSNGLSSSFTFLGETPAVGSALGTMKFKLEVSGNFDKLLQFPKTLQTFTYFATYDSFTITRKNEGGTLTTEGMVYYRQ